MKSILCIDGGGMRGIIPLIMIDIVNQNNNLLDKIDIISGSSIGAFIGCALIIPNDDNTSYKYNSQELIKIFKEKMPKIFYSSWYHWTTFGGFYGPKYTDHNMIEELKTLFGDLKIKDLLKPIIIPSYDILKDEIFIYNTKDHGELYVKDMIRSVTAAPTYFYPSNTKINEDEKILIDGGIVWNNTSKLCFNYLLSNDASDIYIILKIQKL